MVELRSKNKKDKFMNKWQMLDTNQSGDLTIESVLEYFRSNEMKIIDLNYESLSVAFDHLEQDYSNVDIYLKLLFYVRKVFSSKSSTALPPFVH